jgi:hypothetical protein
VNLLEGFVQGRKLQAVRHSMMMAQGALLPGSGGAVSSLMVCWSAQALHGSYGLLPQSTIRHVTSSLALQQCRVSRAHAPHQDHIGRYTAPLGMRQCRLRVCGVFFRTVLKT